MSDMSMGEFQELLKASSLGTPEVVDAWESATGIGPFKAELDELLAEPEPDPRQLRRIAELMEIVRGDAEAREWWERAAEAGDSDAKDYLRVLDDEQGV
ncbi:hypothetical protein [Streptomyces sp. NPDC006631]|uniref:hypothetical protein n=1 Tax=Streptomyces sp. NPDC006631 TaxID=3364752 RepID=UPI0036BCFEB4